jgi:hypothetical protein
VSASGWRAKREEIKAARIELNAHFSIMTPYERIVNERAVLQRLELHENDVISGVIGEWNGTVTQLKERLEAVQKAQQREVARWEPVRLGAEMNVYTTLINQAIGANVGSALEGDVLERLRTIYSEAKTSGDQYKARAAAECVRDLANRAADLDSKRLLNRVAAQAKRDLAQMKNTPELEAAHQAAGEAVEALNTAQKELYNTAEALGYVNPNGTLREERIIKALSRVEQTPDGGLVVDPKKEL